MISIISTTDRENSVSSKLAKIINDKLVASGVEAQILDLSTLEKDKVFSGSYGASPKYLNDLEAKYIAEVDRIIMVVPEYNGSFPGIFKYIMDLGNPKSYLGKRVCLIGLGAGRGGNLRGVDHLTGVLHYLKAEVFCLKVYINEVFKYIDDNGEMKDQFTSDLLSEQLDGFLKF